MIWGLSEGGAPVWVFVMSDGCEIEAAGIDRTDAMARAEAMHDGCTKHTEACNQLGKLMKHTLDIPIQCTGECQLAQATVAS